MAVLAVLVLGHVVAASTGSGTTGLLLLADHIYSIGLVLAVLVVTLAAGGTGLRAAGFGGLSASVHLLAALVIGAGGVGALLLVLGLSGALGAWPFTGVLLGGGWVCREEIGRIGGKVSAVLEATPQVVWTVTAVLGTALLLRGLAPPTDWDSLMYHLHLPELFLEEGRIFLPDDTQHVAFVGLAHMLYLPLLELGGTSAPALLNLAFGLLLPLAVYSLARRVAGPVASEMAGIAVWGTTAVALVAVTARVDVTLVFFLTVGHLALYEAFAGEGDTRWLMLAAVVLGLAVGVKYQAGGYILALVPLVFWSALKGGAVNRVGWKDVVVFGGVLAAVALPWFVKNWIVLDAPFYPFLAERQLPTWLADLHGSRTVPASVDAAVFGALGELRRPFGLVEAFLHPERLSPEGEAAHYHLSPLLLLLPAWVAWIQDRDLAWLLMPGLGYVALVLVISPRTNLRYLLPAIPPLTVASSVLATRIVDRGLTLFGPSATRRDESEGGGDSSPTARHRPRLRVAAVALAVASLVPTGMSLYQWLPSEVSLAHLAGAESRSEYLSERRNPALVTQAGLTDFGERAPPEDARVLMMFEARELYFTVQTLQDPLLTNWSLLAPMSGELDCLRATDITHVLVGTGVLGYYFDRGLDPETVRWPEFLEFADRCLEQELEVPGYVLFRVPPPTAGISRQDRPTAGSPPGSP